MGLSAAVLNGMPFTKMKKNSGPNKSPCGTPTATAAGSEMWPLNLTTCLRFERYDVNQIIEFEVSEQR